MGLDGVSRCTHTDERGTSRVDERVVVRKRDVVAQRVAQAEDEPVLDGKTTELDGMLTARPYRIAAE